MRRSRGGRFVFAACAAAFGASLVAAPPGPAEASVIAQPSTTPTVSAVATSSTSSAITVVASGFVANTLVYVEQCDGVAPSTPLWSPTVHCDLGSSPSAAIVDQRGFATFSSTDRNRAFRPFVGESPQSLFNCLAPSQPPLANGLPSFDHCTVRVSTSNTNPTSDQSFLTLAFTTNRAAVSTTHEMASTTAAKRARASKRTSTSPGASAARREARRAAGRDETAAASIARVEAGHAKDGLVPFFEPSLAAGSALVLGGLSIAGLTIFLRRRDATSWVR
jgi:hypothetical protein